MKSIKITNSEKQRCEKASNGREYTIITRTQSNKKILVAAVWLDNCQIIDHYCMIYVDSKMDISKAVKSILRMMDKLAGFGGPMADKSRMRK